MRLGSGLQALQARRRYVTQRDLKKHGWTDVCLARTELSPARAAVKAHNGECRGRIAAEMDRDDGLAAGDRLRRHVEREGEFRKKWNLYQDLCSTSA